jgi:ribosomal protein L10
MASLEEKKKAVAELEEKFKTSKAAVFTDYRGIKVEEASAPRATYFEIVAVAAPTLIPQSFPNSFIEST